MVKSLVAVSALLLLPLLARGGYLEHLLVLWMIFALMALSLNIIVGYLGELSFGHAAFFGIGAYTSAMLALDLRVPFWAGLVAAPVIAGLFGLAIGYVSLRIKGPQFAILTLGFGAILYTVVNHWVDFTRGPLGLTKIPPPPGLRLPGIAAIHFTDALAYYYLTLLFVLLAAYLSHALVNSRTGRALLAIRENDGLAASIGIDVFGYKLLGFTLATMLVGIAGSLYAHYLRVITPELFGLYYNATMLIMVIVGGKATIAGPVIGALVHVGLLEMLRVTGSLRLVVFSVLLIACVIFLPGGLVSLWRIHVAGRLARVRTVAQETPAP